MARSWAFYSLALAISAVAFYLWSQTLYLQHRAAIARHITLGTPLPPPWLSAGATNTVRLLALVCALASLLLASLAMSFGASRFGTIVLLLYSLFFLFALLFLPVF